MRLSPRAAQRAFVIVLAALIAACSGGAQVGQPPTAGGSLQSFHRSSSGTEAVLYSFQGGADDGLGPYGSPIADSSGALYGTTMNTTTNVPGVVWKLTPKGSSYTESALYKFPSNKANGAYPEAGLIVDKSGTLYGTTSTGGKGKCTFFGSSGCGVVFKLTRKGSGYTESVLRNFGTGGANDGTIPVDALLLVGSEIYGTTTYGGTGSCSGNLNGCGTVFKVTSKGTGYAVLYSFQGGKDGEYPEVTLSAGKNGALFGTTNNGGGATSCPNGCGTVFKLTPKGSGYTETILHSFQAGKDGNIPGDRGRGMYADATGALVGTTQVGGTGGCALGFFPGCGTVFKLTPKGAGYAKSTIYNFQGGSDGEFPYEALAADKSGALYGTTFGGGGSSCACGTVFKLTPSNKGYTESVVYSFQGGNDGQLPYDGVTTDAAGTLFGTTFLGGGSSSCSQGCGTVFSVVP